MRLCLVIAFCALASACTSREDRMWSDVATILHHTQPHKEKPNG